MSTTDTILPSRFKIGEEVTITARVAGVHFIGGKVRYAFDLGPDLSIVDSDHVQPKQAAADPDAIEQRRDAVEMALRTQSLHTHYDVIAAAKQYVDYIHKGDA